MGIYGYFYKLLHQISLNSAKIALSGILTLKNTWVLHRYSWVYPCVPFYLFSKSILQSLNSGRSLRAGLCAHTAQALAQCH
jgi:hypothetical protein